MFRHFPIRSLETDMYNHITATYYLLAERRLRKHRQDLANQTAMLQLRKKSAPPGPKPHLEPLALSPRYVHVVCLCIHFVFHLTVQQNT